MGRLVCEFFPCPLFSFSLQVSAAVCFFCYCSYNLQALTSGWGIIVSISFRRFKEQVLLKGLGFSVVFFFCFFICMEQRRRVWQVREEGESKKKYRKQMQGCCTEE
ncbi:hypothetical protein CCMA1212_007830 [Trichoderma ghanense]|uniref:Uncharacterized protein n=1 Tax=Trichoderma ghanense TaxID=65468 RepID=A0ABY2GWX0_9HYPO